MIRAFILRVMRLFFRICISFRYRVDVRGKEVLDDPRYKGKGTLVLSNHASEVDPFLLLMLMGVNFELRPLVTESFFYKTISNFF